METNFLKPKKTKLRPQKADREENFSKKQKGLNNDTQVLWESPKKDVQNPKTTSDHLNNLIIKNAKPKRKTTKKVVPKSISKKPIEKK